MDFAARLAAGRFAVTLEITPPRAPAPAVLLRRAALLGPAAHAVNVIERPGRQPSLDASVTLASEGLEPVWHLVTRGRAVAEVRADAVRARRAGIRAVLCLRGDASGPGGESGIAIRDAVAIIREAMPGALAGATLNHHLPAREAVLANLRGKLAAGAAWVETQPVFGLATLRPYAEALLEAAPAVRIVPMVVPVLSVSALEGLERRLRIALPAGAPVRRAAPDPEAAWEVFAAQVAECVAAPFVHGLAIMTMEMDPGPESGAHIAAALKAAGALC